MTSKIKVNILADGADNSIITSDGAGSFTASSSLASSVQSVGGIQMTPAFEAYLSSTQTLSFNADTKIQFDTEVFDTDGCYDNSTNYRFTPTVAGKYYVYGNINFAVGNSELSYAQNIIKKNGSDYREVTVDPRNNLTRGVSISNYGIIDMNGSTDYLELYGRANTTGVNPDADYFAKRTFFGAYKVIGA